MSDAVAIEAALVQIDQLIQAGRLDDAEAACRELVGGTPDLVNGWVRLGLVSSWRSAFPAAEESFRRAAALQPNEPRIWNELSVAINKQGRGAEAEECARRAIALDPANADHWASLGNALGKDWRWSEATEALRRSLAIQPGAAAIWNNLGDAELKLGRFDAAKLALEQAMALAPGNVEPIANYAFVLCRMDQREQAVQWLQSTLVRNPQLPENWLLMGQLWQAMAEWELAEAAYRRALALAPHHGAAQFQLARALRSNRRFTEAEQVLRDLLGREPQQADAWALLGEVVSAQGRASESGPCFRKAADVAPSEDRVARLLTGLQYDEATSPEPLLAAHRQWNAVYAQPLLPAQPVKPVKLATDRPLRIGFVSSDFGRHPTAFLVLPALAHLDRAACSVVCYADRAQEDEYSARFRAAAAQWRVIFGQSDEDVAAQIRRDQIDILFDLMGHNGKRLLVFARKPAPIQVTWFGYVGTTGLGAMDYLLADRFHVREGEEPWYSETVLRMPHGYACYDGPPDAPIVRPLPALANGYITFGCFNNAAKYSPQMLEAWATILRRLPTARLLLKTGAFGDAGVERRWREWFAAHGIAEERILTEGWSPQAELLGCYNRVDLALDTQPYSGGLTTCEALWMGVPVISFPGKTFAGRHSTSHMTNAGYEQFVAADLEGYIELAVAWGQKLDGLAGLRAEMRERVRQSPLCDAPRFARDLINALRGAWKAKETQEN